MGNKKKYLRTAGIVLAVVGIGLFVWNQFKYKFVHQKLHETVSQKTDSLYSITYDSLYFDEALGNAYIKNVHIQPNTGRIKRLSPHKMPSAIVDVKIASIKINGVKTLNALNGSSLQGDSVIISSPVICMYSMKELSKKTKIEAEAGKLYESILGKLKFIKLNYLQIDDISLSGAHLETGRKDFELYKGNVTVRNILIDSAHDDQPNRMLFSKDLHVNADSFVTYSFDRRQFYLRTIQYSATDQILNFGSLQFNKFVNDSAATGYPLLEAQNLRISGLNSDSVIKNKAFWIDSIYCPNIVFHEPPEMEIAPGKASEDSTGFTRVYSIHLNHLAFPKVRFVSSGNGNYDVGNLSLHIRGVEAAQLRYLEKRPFDYSKEVKLQLSSLSHKSKDKKYTFQYKNILINSLEKSMRVGQFAVVPYLPEMKFHAREKYQADRFDVQMNGLRFSGIEMNDVLDGRVFAQQLEVSGTRANIYRDLKKPLQQKSKVGNYPSQLIQNLDFPINLRKAVLQNALVRYKERQAETDSTGIVTFEDAKISITNITNVEEVLREHPELKVDFQANVLGIIPLKGNFIFGLQSKSGQFRANGTAGSFDAVALNKIAIPMAMIKIEQGKINALDFHLKGNDHEAHGEVVFQYEDLKVQVLKRDKETNDIKKRGFLSFLANAMLNNSNPSNGELRKVQAEYERNEYKSFFNLVWKTLFDGLKKSVGMP